MYHICKKEVDFLADKAKAKILQMAIMWIKSQNSSPTFLILFYNQSQKPLHVELLCNPVVLSALASDISSYK